MKQVGGKVGVVATGSKGVGKQVGAGREQSLGAMPYPDQKAELRGEGCTPTSTGSLSQGEMGLSDGLA